MSQPDTTIEDILLQQVHNCMGENPQECMKNVKKAAQQLESYINNKVKEARLKDWQDYWQFWIDPLNDDIECEEYIKDRIKELKSTTKELEK